MKNPRDLTDRIRAILASREQRIITGEDLIPAAVLLPLVGREGSYHILLTKRTHKVKTHKGEISFPGGVYDQEDKTLEKTALRESFEEIGLREKDIEILGCLDDVETTTHYRIRPFVGAVPCPYPFVINREEIEQLIELPLDRLRPKDFMKQAKLSLQSGDRIVYAYHHGRHVIWGATAAILKQFLGLIRQPR
jgi:8-oxo-dGTP pyrophosphatase MutT (NUDIX family)